MTVKVTIQSIVNSTPLILPLLFFALLFFQKLLAQNNVAAFTNSRGAYEAKHDEVKCNELVIFILNSFYLLHFVVVPLSVTYLIFVSVLSSSKHYSNRRLFVRLDGSFNQHFS